MVRDTEDPAEFLFCELDEDLAWVHAGSDAEHDGRYLTSELKDQARKQDADHGIAIDTLTNRARSYGHAAAVAGPHGAHRWRHTHASELAQAGMSLEAIGERLGHDLSKREGGIGWNPITLAYISLSSQYLANLVEAALPNPFTD